MCTLERICYDYLETKPWNYIRLRNYYYMLQARTLDSFSSCTHLFFCSTQTNFWILLKHTDENTKKVSPLPLSLCLSVNAFLFSKAKIRHLTDDVGIWNCAWKLHVNQLWRQLQNKTNWKLKTTSKMKTTIKMKTTSKIKLTLKTKTISTK